MVDHTHSSSERLLDEGYELFFKATVNEPFLNFELFRAALADDSASPPAPD